ncbi:MAG: amidohydrolase family protein [Pseudomonadota bacterium]
MPERIRIYRAKWVFPVSSDPIEDGAVVVSANEIRDVGRFREIETTWSGEVIDNGPGAILPAFVNAHTHLELSVMRGRLSGEGGFAGWIRQLIELRGKLSREEIGKAIRDELASMNKQGIRLVGDTGNTPASFQPCRDARGIETVFFREYLGFNETRTKEAKNTLLKTGDLFDYDDSFHLAAHSPYTVSEELFRFLKQWTNKHGKMLSVHLGESVEESEFLTHGNGPLMDLLIERSAWNEKFEPPGKTPVSYLDRLGVLDRNTICVHLVHLSQEEMKTLAERRVRCCLCPRSNLFLRVGFPNISGLLDHGISPALGTDSPASNDSLSMLDEMACVHKHEPGIPPEDILKMATLNGACLLDRDYRLGSLAPGKDSEMIFIPVEEKTFRGALEFLMDNSKTVSVSWIR